VVGTEISLAGRLVTSRWRSGTEETAGGAPGVGPVDPGRDESGLFAGAAGSDLVEVGAGESPDAASSETRAARDEPARAGFGSAGSSGCTARRSPSLSALRRTRSAWASSIEEEWLFTPMPNDTQRSRASLLVRPSSRASS
jgi:hypothetical protein